MPVGHHSSFRMTSFQRLTKQSLSTVIILIFLCDDADFPLWWCWVPSVMVLIFLCDTADFPLLWCWFSSVMLLIFLCDDADFPLWWCWFPSMMLQISLCADADFPLCADADFSLCWCWFSSSPVPSRLQRIHWTATAWSVSGASRSQRLHKSESSVISRLLIWLFCMSCFRQKIFEIYMIEKGGAGGLKRVGWGGRLKRVGGGRG